VDPEGCAVMLVEKFCIVESEVPIASSGKVESFLLYRDFQAKKKLVQGLYCIKLFLYYL
jgi:hypothetical protein